jgi:hypothetical protein
MSNDTTVCDLARLNKEISAFTRHMAFYNEQAAIVIQFCEERGIAYHIKNGTMT